jgi:hypothetical protein
MLGTGKRETKVTENESAQNLHFATEQHDCARLLASEKSNELDPI